MTRQEAKNAGLCTMCFKVPSQEGKGFCNKCRQYCREHYKKLYLQRRQIIFEHYGNRCACCGEHEQAFFTMDHVNNDGYIERANTSGGGRDFYRELAKIIKNGGSRADLQILCRNCNWGRHANDGICPHQVR